MKFQAKGKWKSIPMPHTFFTTGLDSAMCGGIEVLDEYNTNTKPSSDESTKKDAVKRKSDSTGEQVSPSKKKKKNLFEVSDVAEAEKYEEEKKTDIKKKNKKKNKKKVKNKPAINLEILQNFNASKVEAQNLKKDETSSSKDKNESESKEESESNKDSGIENDDGDVVDDTEDVDNDEASEENVKDDSESKKLSYDDMAEWRNVFVSEEIISALAEKGFQSPTSIQRLTLPSAIKGRLDIVGAAETGSGKTLSFAIPIVQGILEDRKREDNGNAKPVEDEDNDPETEAQSEESTAENKSGKLKALILTPTRELAIQIKDHIKDILTKTDVSIAVVVGGMCPEKQLRLLKRRPDIVVGTPGRLWELAQEGEPHLQDLPNIKYLAIDETDRMSEKGHFAELEKILEMVQSGQTKKQRFVMSATLSLVHKAPFYKKGKRLKQKSPKEKLKELMDFAGVAEKRKVVDITRKVGTAENLTESVIHCSLEEKDAYLYYFIKCHKGRTIVFCNSIDCVRRLAILFSYLDTKPLPLHAQMHQKQRLKNLDRFSKSQEGLLIATDVAARGLDIPNIQHVLHYQVPRTSESYIHRSGRTARASNEGLSVLLIDPSELHLYKRLTATLARNTDMPLFPIDESRFSLVTRRMDCAHRLDKLMLQARRKKVDDTWMQKTAEEAELLLSEDDDEDLQVEQKRENKALNQEIEAKRQELKALLSKSLTLTGKFETRYPTQSGSLPTFLPATHTSAISALNSNIENETKLKKELLRQNNKKNMQKKIQKNKSKRKQKSKK